MPEINFFSTGPISSKEETMSTVLGASERGISPNSAVSGSCMMTVPPAWLTVRAPSVPSVPVPLRTTAMRFSP